MGIIDNYYSLFEIDAQAWNPDNCHLCKGIDREFKYTKEAIKPGSRT